MQIEKQYGSQFWQTDYRRIQASVVHFGIFLKALVHMMFLEGYANLLALNKEDKLVVPFTALEVF